MSSTQPAARHPARPSSSLRWMSLLAALLIPPAHPALAQMAPAPAPTPASAPAVPAPPSLEAPDPRTAAPGEYATLIFRASGQGDYDMTVDAGPDWVPVSSGRRVSLNGPTLVPVTFRVPPRAPVGDSPDIVMRLASGGQVAARASTRVRVSAQARLVGRAPGRLTAQLRRKVAFEAQFTNQGNQDDTLTLRAVNVDALPQLSVPSLRLRPGETGSVGVSFSIDEASPGYEYTVTLEATSQNNPAVKVRALTDVVFNPVNLQGNRNADRPQLVFGVQAGADAAVAWSPAGRQTTLRYSLQPRLGGRLSDYATGESTLSGLDGSSERALPSGLNFGVRLNARTWDLTAYGSRSGVALEANLYRGAWRFRPRLSYRNSGGGGFGVRGGLGVSGPVLGGTLEADADTSVNRSVDGTGGADQLSVRYARQLTPNVGLVVGGLAGGQRGGGPYRVSALGFEQVSYANGTVDLTQTYTGTPTGLHNFSVSGGLTSLRPFGVRAALGVSLQPGGVTYTGSGLLTYAAGNGFGASVGGRYQNSTVRDEAGSTAPPSWAVTGTVRSPALGWKNASLSGAAAYTLATDLDRPGSYGQTVTASAALVTGPVLTNASAQWSRDPQPSGEDLRTLRLNLTGSYSFRLRDTVSADYTFERLQGAVQSTSHAVRAVWTHQWTPQIDTAVNYQRAWVSSASGTYSPEVAGFSVGAQDLFVTGLSARAGYTASAPGGLTRGNLTSTLRFSLNYNVDWAVNTPDPVVNVFGGRRGGELAGTLYRDDNYNGRRDPGESVLAGVTVEAGGVRATSGVDGSYRLRVPVGSFKLSYVSGVPATLESLSDEETVIKENSVNRLDVPFAPVVRSEVLAYDDANRNGRRDEGEAALPFVGVVFSGPVVRSVQADVGGVARVATLPPGRYAISLNPAQLPEGYVATGSAAQAEFRAGERPAVTELGAAMPPRQNVTTFTAGSVAVIGRLSASPALPGSEVGVLLNVQRAAEVQVQAFGQSVTVPVQSGRAETKVKVPVGTAPGEYDVTVTARAGSAEKTTVLKLTVAPAAGTP
ncbi:hypothetical protein [uncultured Deinococcus sp.]|uniref:COG1470 family protein n=1 Tax=uncultured Deinococcus sp. TaxID=158789 RepID=UPI002588665B|nr:hypothetical protein [uncultured Deinococcus sp.]